eukprot:scaffold5977_cov98-Cylindrotheca_fusiformis.AAC.8
MTLEKLRFYSFALVPDQMWFCTPFWPSHEVDFTVNWPFTPKVKPKSTNWRGKSILLPAAKGKLYWTA